MSVALFKLVPPLARCRQLKALGFPQDTALHWREVNGTWRVLQDGDVPGGIAMMGTERVAAPLFDEILDRLPLGIETDEDGEEAEGTLGVAVLSPRSNGGSRRRQVGYFNEGGPEWARTDANGAEAAAQLYVALAENATAEGPDA